MEPHFGKGRPVRTVQSQTSSQKWVWRGWLIYPPYPIATPHEPCAAHSLTHHGSILLFDVTLVIFDPRSPARKGQLFPLTIRDQFLIEELRAAIGIKAQQRKREEHARLR